MNILFISYSFTPHEGGVQRVTDILTKEFQKRGHNVYYLCGRTENEGKCINIAAPVYYMDKTLDQAFDNRSIDLYVEYLKELNINIIIDQYPIRSKSDFFLKKADENILKISCYHGMPFGFISDKLKALTQCTFALKRIPLQIYWKLLDLFYAYRFFCITKYSDKLCLLSNYYIEDVLEKVPCIDQKKLCAIGNPNTFSLTNSICWEEKDNIILFVGRISDDVKNLWDFIHVWELASEDLPLWRVEIIGDDKKCDAYKLYIKEKNILRISFKGVQTDIASYYRKAKIVCVTSRHEGWSMVITEGMSYGCIPCVYTTYGAVYNLIDNNENGILCEPYNVNNMANKIIALASDENTMRRLSMNCQIKVKQFNVENIADQWEKLFVK